MVRRHTTPQQIALRAHIILLADQGQRNAQIQRMLGVGKEMVIQWRRRWLEGSQQGIPLAQRLEDAERPGAPPTFTAEQVCQLYAIACSDPEESGRPISHWTAAELADEMARRGIVASISERHVRRLLAEADLKPFRIKYWLTPPPDPDRDDVIREVCRVYEQAPERAEKGGAHSVR